VAGSCVRTVNPFLTPYIPAEAAFAAPPSPLCGNNALNPGEECDDGNASDLDGCSRYCLLEKGKCGDGIVQSLYEQCEPSLNNALPCSQSCRFLLVSCGDGTQNPGEACDDGSFNQNLPGARCRPDCSLARCGDYILDPAEACDDGNRIPGDGCDAFCRTERAAGTTNPETLPATVIDLPFTPDAAPSPLSASTLNPPLSQVPQNADSGPEALAIMASGAAAGYAWMRRRRVG
jgi:cysteine-rich repeat protein